MTHTKVVLEESESLDTLSGLIASADENYEGTVTRWRYRNINDGIGTVTHTGTSAYLLIQLLGSLEDTDEIAPHISDEAWDPDKRQHPVAVGTEWYQVGETLYRATYDSNSVYRFARVTSHYGEGIVLETDDEFWEIFNAIDAYHPKATYRGEYDNGVLNLTHVYPGEDDITIVVKDFEPGTVTNDPTVTENNLLTLEITAVTDRELTLDLDCSRSSDHGFDYQKQTVSLKAGEPKIVRLSYRATTWNYQLSLYAQNTRIFIHFSSTKTT